MCSTCLKRSTYIFRPEGESSSNADEPADPKARARCGQFVWPCPRQYLADAASRKSRNCLIPADLSNEEAGKMFLQALGKCNQHSNISRLHVFDEPHKKYDKETGQRARHKHFIFKFVRPFAHVRLGHLLAQGGVHGHFSFNLVGYQAYLKYCLVASAHKLAADLDKDPWHWPSHVTTPQLMQLCQQSVPQMEARNGQPGKKRTLMTFSEITDAFVEHSVQTCKDAWQLAKARKISGDETLWNTLGAQANVAGLVHKVLCAWNAENMDSGSFVAVPDFVLSSFVPLPQIHERLPWWLQGGFKEVTLILEGRGGLGKTEFACALMHACVGQVGFHFINRLDRLRDISFGPKQGLVFDEACMAERSIDDVKGLVDLSKTRDIVARNADGTIPKQTPRIFSTNWTWDRFWPKEVGTVEHNTAINRRVLWVRVNEDIRLLANSHGPARQDDDDEDEEDVFGHSREAI